MICYPHPFYKGQNQDLSLAMGVNTLGRVEVELGGWVVKSYAGAVKKGKAITNCFDLPLTPSQTPSCKQPDRQVLSRVIFCIAGSFFGRFSHSIWLWKATDL